jgi:DNA polymerase IV
VLVREEDERDAFDPGVLAQLLARRAERDIGRLADRVAVDARRDRRESHGSAAELRRDLERPPVAGRKQLGFALAAAVPDGTDRMDHIPGGELSRSRRLRIARLAAAQLTALGQDRRPACAMDGSVHAAAAEQRRVRGVHDRVDLLRRDVALNELDPAHRERVVCEHTFVVDPATILHADLDAFFAAVEQRDHPQLRGRPVIVGGGVVLAPSYEAKAHGVQTAMSVRRALQLCPRAVVVSPRMAAYAEASKAVYRVFDDTTPLVEGLSIDEAFLDVRGMRRLAGTPTDIARRLRRDVRDRVGLPITVGIARTKFLAKVASAVAKPDGLLAVPPEGELEFLHPLPVERLWGVGQVTARRLHAAGITTVAQVAELPESALVTLLGRAAGRHLHALAHNRDPRRVQPRRRRGSIGAQRALGWSPTSLTEVDVSLVGLVERVTRRMRAADRLGRTVVLRMRFDDSSRATRSQTLPYATANTQTILTAARELLAVAVPLIERQGITLVGIAVSNLADGRAGQLMLPLDEHWSEALDAALDEVRERFGTTAIVRAVLLGRSRGVAMPLLPD